MPSQDEVIQAYRRGFQEGVEACLEQAARGELMPPYNIRQMATGGLVTRPTLTMLGEAGPELVIPIKKRKVSAYHKRLGRAIKSLRAKHLLKNGKWRKGWNQRKMMKAAHKIAGKR